MSFAVAALLIVGVAALVAYPLLTVEKKGTPYDFPADRETFEREKNVALLAIREADLDRAMGKLSEEDYASLRGLYENRALAALNALDVANAEASASHARPGIDAHGEGTLRAEQDGSDSTLPTFAVARFCAGCARAFVSDERYCPACGRPRAC